VIDHVSGWSATPAQTLEEAEKAARQAERLNERNPYALWALGVACLWAYDEAVSATERTLAFNPNFAAGLNREDVGHVPVEPLGPEAPASRGVDELRGNPDPGSRFPNTPFEDIAHAEIFRDLRHAATSTFLPLNVKEKLRPMTKSCQSFDTARPAIIRASHLARVQADLLHLESPRH